jgi:hypothetical protein
VGSRDRAKAEHVAQAAGTRWGPSAPRRAAGPRRGLSTLRRARTPWSGRKPAALGTEAGLQEREGGARPRQAWGAPRPRQGRARQGPRRVGTSAPREGPSARGREGPRRSIRAELDGRHRWGERGGATPGPSTPSLADAMAGGTKEEEGGWGRGGRGAHHGGEGRANGCGVGEGVVEGREREIACRGG